MTAYRISVTATVDVNTAGPATRDELVEIGQGIALGTGYPAPVLLASPVTGTIGVEIETPECQDPDHRRNSIDGRTYMCGAYADDPIHGSFDDCPGTDVGACMKPAEHHAFMSPGFEAPAS